MEFNSGFKGLNGVLRKRSNVTYWYQYHIPLHIPRKETGKFKLDCRVSLCRGCRHMFFCPFDLMTDVKDPLEWVLKIMT